MIAEDVPADSPARKLTPAERAAWFHRGMWCDAANHPKRGGKQIPPEDLLWNILFFRSGRGFGKTRSLTEWLWWEMWRLPGAKLIGHACAATLSDVIGTVFEGPVGFQAVVPAECLRGASWEQAFNKNDKKLFLNNGAIIRGFATTEEGNRLRGPQCMAAVGDEAAAWDKPAGNFEVAFNNMMFGVRLPYPDGTPARALFGTTPKPIPFMKRLEKRTDVRVVEGSSYENLANLSDAYRQTLFALAGTQIGKQEIEGKYIDEDDISILKRGWFRLWPADKKLPEFSFIVEVYDTATSEENFNVKTQKTDPSGSIVLGVFNVNQCFDEKERKRLGVRHKYAAVLCEAWTEYLGFPDLLERARKQHRVKWGRPGRRADIVLIEDKSNGASLRQTLATYGVPGWPYNPGQMSKTQRAHAASPFIKQGAIFVPESAMEERKGLPRDWVEPFLEQVCGFSGKGSVEHDEFLDCVLGNTGVYTKRGLVRMDSVVIGDEVLTHQNRWCRVTGTSNRPSDHYFRLKAKGLDEIGLTGNHKVLTMKVAASQRKGKETRGLEWKRTDELKVRPTRRMMVKGKACEVVSRVIHDTLLIPRVKADDHATVDLARYFPDGGMKVTDDSLVPLAGKRVPVPRFLRLDQEAGWAMGLFVAEGCVSGRHIVWSCDEAAIQRCAAWARNTFGRHGSISRRSYMSAFTLGATAVMPLFREFGYLANSKTVPPWCLSAPEEFVRGFVDGFAHGDGYRSPANYVTVSSISEGLLFGVRLMLARLGIAAWRSQGKPAGYRKVFGRETDCQRSYTLSYTDTARSWMANVTPEYIGTHIECCERVEESVQVFNLSVEEDESYLTVGGIVHNCLTSGVIYLRDRNMLEATPDEKYLDLEEKKEAEEREALRLRDREKPRTNPYA